MSEQQQNIILSPEAVEVNLMYLMAFGIWFLSADAQRRMEVYEEGLQHQQKQAFNAIIKNLKGAQVQHEILFQDYVRAWKNNTEKYTQEQENANIVTRLLLLFYDRVLGWRDREEAVFKFIRENFPEESITEEVLKRFYIKKL